MRFGIRNGDECWNMAVMVEQGVHFDAAFALTKSRPREERKAKLDGGGVQAEQLGFETKLVLRGLGGAQRVHFGEQILKEAHGPGIVGIGKSRAGHGFQTSVVQALSRRFKTAQTIAHGAPGGKLDEGHDSELLLEAKSTGSASSFVAGFQFLNNMSGDQG